MSDDHRLLDLGDTPEEQETKTISGWDYLSGGGLIRCVFSSSKIVKMGMGANSRKHESVVYWFVEQTDSDEFEVRKINEKNVPSGNAETVRIHRLINDFTPELSYYEDVVLPAMEELEEILDQGDEFRENGELYSAEMEYNRALTIEERNVRALFGLGLVFASRREDDRTRIVLAELVQVKAAFDGKNQHLFNEFGIALRKTCLFNESVVYYKRALDFVVDDENLYYNLARAHYENDDWNSCLEGLVMSHRLNPGLRVARDLFELMVGLSENEELLHRYRKPPVPTGVAARARQILAVEHGKLALDEGPVFGVRKGRGRARYGDVVDVDGYGDD